MDDLTRILERYPSARRQDLIPILQEVQTVHGHLSAETVGAVARHLNLPTAKVYGVATFYNQFRFSASGRNHVQVCRGTACHVKGSAAVLEALLRELKIKPGETTRDGAFSLEVVACIGACGLAPVISVNGEFHGNLTPAQVPGILERYRKAGGAAVQVEAAVTAAEATA